jgi:glycosyltransferase involved in cell wall biosynthesis
VVRRDAGQVANAIDAILQAPDKSEKMRAAGRRFATEHLSWSKIASIVTAAYEDAIADFRNHKQLREAGRETQLGASV